MMGKMVYGKNCERKKKRISIFISNIHKLRVGFINIGTDCQQEAHVIQQTKIVL